MMWFVLAAKLALFALDSVPVEQEAAFVARLHGLDPALAVAVMRVESGSNPDAVSLDGDDLGAMQVNCPTWREYYGLRSCDDLLGRHTNILIGMDILAGYKRTFEWVDGWLWVGHYNSGNVLTERGERFAGKVWGVRTSVVRELRANAGRS